MDVTVTTKAVLEGIVRGIRSAESHVIQINDECERGEVYSLISALKQEIGDFVKMHRDPERDAALEHEESGPPNHCLFCGWSYLKLRRLDRAGKGYWFCPACEQEMVVEEDSAIYQQSAG